MQFVQLRKLELSLPMFKNTKTVAFTLSFTLLPFAPFMETVSASASCAKINATKTVKGVKYTCVNSGKKKIWTKVVAPATTTTTTVPLPVLATTPRTPPLSGTGFLDADLITASDPTVFQTLTAKGQAERTMFDRRPAAFIKLNAFLFEAKYGDGLTVEIQVNPEFGSSAAAQLQAEKYAPVIGRLPKGLRLSVETVWIHKGIYDFGGGNKNLLIHTERGDEYIASGFLEEIFLHEGVHTSLDDPYATSTGWLAAQKNDQSNFISTYARDNSTREDLAESFVAWFAARHRSSRITSDNASTITQTIPNRLAYFDSLKIDLAPLK